MSTVGLLSNELVWLDDKVDDVPANYSEHEITESGGNNCSYKPSPGCLPESIDCRDPRSEDKGRRDDEKPGEHDMRVTVSDSLEDGVMDEQSVEPVEI
jgi:hypothetical protein